MHVYPIINMFMYDVVLEIKVLKINIISHQYWRQIKQILQLQNITIILVFLYKKNIIKTTSIKNYLWRK
jgi:hypothetical protein